MSDIMYIVYNSLSRCYFICRSPFLSCFRILKIGYVLITSIPRFVVIGLLHLWLHTHSSLYEDCMIDISLY
jgi:hypothetical protein